jgi:hypothetical protein
VAKSPAKVVTTKKLQVAQQNSGQNSVFWMLGVFDANRLILQAHEYSHW